MKGWMIIPAILLLLGWGCASVGFEEEEELSDVSARIKAGRRHRQPGPPPTPEEAAVYGQALLEHSSELFPGDPEDEDWFSIHRINIQEVFRPEEGTDRPVIVMALVDGEVTEEHKAWWYQRRSGLVTLLVHAVFSQGGAYLGIRDSGIHEVLGED